MSTILRKESMNEYTQIARHYDNLMASGYYDHRAMAESLAGHIRSNDAVLELGVGTGLMIEQLALLRPGCRMTGVDSTQAMLDIAQERIGVRCRLVHADVTTMELGEKFDIIFNCGGVWAVLDVGFEMQLGSHIPDLDQNACALRNVLAHLKPGGLFLLSIQGVQKDLEMHLKDGTVHRQIVSWRGDLFEKEFIFENASGTVSQRNLFRIWHQPQMLELLGQHGLKPLAKIPDDRFCAFRKVPHAVA